MTAETRERIHRLRAGYRELELDCQGQRLRLLAMRVQTPEEIHQGAREVFHELTEAQRELAAEDDPTGHFGDQLARIPDLIDAALDLVR